MKDKIVHITYSNKIVVKNGVYTKTYPYGYLHSKEFKALIANYRNKGFAIKKTTNFYPDQCITDKSKEIKLKVLPRDYQEAAISFSDKHVYNGFIESPPGSGKTNMQAYLIAKKNLKTIIIVPKTSLVNQTVKRLKMVLDIPPYCIGKLNAKKKDFDFPIIVTTWQALNVLSTRTAVLKAGYVMLICDEAHKSTANKLFDFIGEFKSKYKFGFTASPKFSKKTKENKLYEILGLKLIKIPIELLYEKGYLLRPNVCFVKTGIPFTLNAGIRYEQEAKIRKNVKLRWLLVNRLFDNKNLKSLIPPNKLKKDIAMNPTEDDIVILGLVYMRTSFPEELEFNKQVGIAKKGIENLEKRKEMINIFLSSSYGFKKENEKAIALFNTVKSARDFADYMLSKGYKNIKLVTGKTTGSNELIDALSQGTDDNYIISSTVQFLSEGTDVPTLQKIALCSPVYPPYSDLARLLQIIGRVVRPDFADLNKKPIFYIFDDISSGWENKKKMETYDYAFEEFAPNFLPELEAKYIVDEFKNQQPNRPEEIDCIQYVDKIIKKDINCKLFFSVNDLIEENSRSCPPRR